MLKLYDRPAAAFINRRYVLTTKILALGNMLGPSQVPNLPLVGKVAKVAEAKTEKPERRPTAPSPATGAGRAARGKATPSHYNQSLS